MNVIKLQPSYKEYIWGGTKLKKMYGKVSDLDTIAESWELSSYKDSESIVASGPYKGKNFREYLTANAKDILGVNGQNFEEFPLLIKLIDAKSHLSVQVHPDDNYALAHEHSYGKTEMWHVLDCEEGAFLYYGVNQVLTKEQLYQHIKEQTLTTVLNKVMVKPGDTFLIHAGTIHAIGAGIVLCEIQQNSNITYRLYDYGRKDASGKERPLHIDKAMDVCKLCPEKGYLSGDNIAYKEKGIDHIRQLVTSKYFKTMLYEIAESYKLDSQSDSFRSVLILEGEGCLEEADEKLDFIKGDSFFVPAGSLPIKVRGTCKMIVSNV